MRCQANKLSKQAKAWCLMLCGCGGGARCWSIQAKVWLGLVLGVGAKLSNGAKQTSKGLVWVQGCGLISKQGLGAWFLCWVGAICKQRLGAWCGC